MFPQDAAHPFHDSRYLDADRELRRDLVLLAAHRRARRLRRAPRLRAR